MKKTIKQKVKQKEGEIEVSIPKNFNGEINVMGVHFGPKVDPLTEEFSNGDMNVLRNKINEIIARI